MPLGTDTWTMSPGANLSPALEINDIEPHLVTQTRLSFSGVWKDTERERETNIHPENVNGPSPCPFTVFAHHEETKLLHFVTQR